MTSYVIYGDVLWLINFVLDFAILWCTGKFSRTDTTYLKLFLSACLGAFYGVLMVFPQFAFFYGLGFKVLFPLVMLGIAFGKLPWQIFLKLLLYFYLISFAMSGGVMAGQSLLGAGGVFAEYLKPINGALLLFALVVGLILGRFGLGYLQKTWARKGLIRTAAFVYEQQQVEGAVFLDTGNELTEPISGKSVLVVEYSLIREILPLALKALLDVGMSNPLKPLDPIAILADSLQADWAKALTLIPYHGIGKENGVLLGFKPTLVQFDQVICKELILGIYQGEIGGLKGYQGIVNPWVITLGEQAQKAG